VSTPVNSVNPLAPIKLEKPQQRINYIKSVCAGKSVLDIGCLDETAFNKKANSGFWLHEEIAKVARSIVGIDNSSVLGGKSLETGFSTILCHDILKVTSVDIPGVEIVVMGELIEHLIDPLSVLTHLLDNFSQCSIVLSTPNATGITNVLGALLNRESNHPDHVAIYSYKTLMTLMNRAGADHVVIQPYLTLYSEALLRNRGVRKKTIQILTYIINRVERIRPLFSAGYVVTISRNMSN